MRADNSHHLRRAAEQRHELTRSKAIAALRELEKQGTAVTFEIVATTAGVSRSWLYSQPDLRNDVIRLRTEHRPDQPPISRRDRVSTDSLHARLATAQERIRTLVDENASLRHQLALALGRARRA
ncbi:DUF6262 family protein [Antrihabitans spumae]|jgi:hypothetical protein|uniref:DUF6262 family protein n=1 Tax=Antrihabitans spumae TaxID=3373370 RepID=A0ABW7JIQ3_9NOCA